jgi:predicted ATPase
MIEELSIRHFKSVEAADIAFEDVTVFVGNNGAGKSNVVDAMRFLRDAAVNGLDRAFSDRHGLESIRQWSPTRPYRITSEVTFTELEFFGKYQVAFDSAKGSYQIFQEDLETRDLMEDFAEDPETNEVERTTFWRRFIVRRDKDGKIVRRTSTERRDESKTFDPNDAFFRFPRDEEAETLKAEALDELLVNQRSRWEYAGIRRRITDFQAYSIYPNTLRVPQEPSNETYLTSDGRNLTSVFKRMRRTKAGLDSINQITNALKAILPGLEQISVLSVGGYLVPQFHLVESNDRHHKANASQMSDGTLRVLGLLTALYQVPRPAVIVLEEPEQTVNPGILAVLAESIKEVSRSAQVIITTHSPHLLDQFAPEQIRAVDLDDGHTRISPVGPTQMSVVHDRLFTLGELLVSEGLHGE